VSITDRDRKIILLLVPIALVAAYWFLLLAPKREEATKVQEQLTQAQSERDTAEQQASSLASAKQNFARDYAAVIYLGKSIPSTVDMPSLIVQLDRAARGTGIEFTSMQVGERTASSASAATDTTTSTTPGAAASAPGQAAQSANGAVAASNASGATGTAPADPAAAGTAGTQTALEQIPLDFEFDGSFFDLADFFHRMKRFVRVANKHIVVRGRLMTINSFGFDAKDSFPSLTATVHATVYLAPKAEGVSAGASPTGPSGSPPPAPPAGQTASDSGKSSPTPAATVTP
jgi:Tfp pilus assembly protein PilO